MAVGKPGLQLLLVCVHLDRHTRRGLRHSPSAHGNYNSNSNTALGFAGVLTKGGSSARCQLINSKMMPSTAMIGQEQSQGVYLRKPKMHLSTSDIKIL